MSGAPLVSLLRSDFEGPLNIASGHGIRVRDLALKAANLAGRHDLLRIGEKNAGSEEPLRLVGDVSRLRAGSRIRNQNTPSRAV